jgi:predicted ATPase
LLEGSLRVSDDGEMSFQPEGMAGNLDMHLASSSVKALAPLVFYLRHVAQRGHFLIIDEPELNLHPDNQRKVARMLGRLARNGIKIMISTHSDYVIRELNNLIMLNSDRQGELCKKYGYRNDEVLSSNNVGAYLFDANNAREIPVKPTGIEVETIDREINQLNQVAQDLFFTLFPDAS